LRNQATVVGTVIAEPAGILSVALLALDARVRRAVLVDNQVVHQGFPLEEFLARREELLSRAIITHILVPASARRAAIETVARTPRDKAIVAVCAVLALEQDQVRGAGLALGGVAETAVRARQAERALAGETLDEQVIGRAANLVTQGLLPTGDFRGSSEYRREMARVLAARALRALL
jgi:CO/xanthine dehydrogenase FAD-binding subunit